LLLGVEGLQNLIFFDDSDTFFYHPKWAKIFSPFATSTKIKC
jgi:hypothetical protein